MTQKWSKEVFSKNLRKYIDRSGKSQKEIAEDLNMTQSAICRYATGEMFPRIDKIQRLADYFGILKSDLIEDKEVDEIKNKDNQVIANVVARSKMDSTYLDFLVETSKLDSSKLESLLSIIKQFSNNVKN